MQRNAMKASAAFGRLTQQVWNRRGIRLETKLKVYRAAVMTTLLYGSESWTVYSRHARKLNHFHTTCLRRILGIKWQDRVPDTEVIEKAGLPSVSTILMQTKHRWAGHVTIAFLNISSLVWGTDRGEEKSQKEIQTHSKILSESLRSEHHLLRKDSRRQKHLETDNLQRGQAT